MAGTGPAPPMLRSELREQRRDVLPPVAQGRQPHGHPFQPRQQIGAEAAGARRVQQRQLTRDDDADVDRDGTGLAERLHLALLEHAQQLGLQRQRQIRHLVEQQRPGLRAAEDAGARLVGAGERPLPVAEQLTFGQRFGERGAVDRDERAAASAPGVDRARHDLLAGSGLALEHDRQIARRRLPQGRDRLGERGAAVAGRARSPRARRAWAVTTPIQPPTRTTSPAARTPCATARPLIRMPLRLPRSCSAAPAPGSVHRSAACRRETSSPSRRTSQAASRPMMSSAGPAARAIERDRRLIG